MIELFTMTVFMTLLRDSARHFNSHHASRMGAALAYYALFALAPLTILLIALVSIIFGNQLTENSMLLQVQRLLGSGSTDFITGLLNTASKTSLSLSGSIVSIITVIFGMLSALSVLTMSLDELWENDEPSTRTEGRFFSRLWQRMRHKLPAFSLIPFIALLFLLLTALSVFASLYYEQLAMFYDFGALIVVLEPLMLFIIGTAFFAFIYRTLPARRLSTHSLLVGGAVTSALFLLGRLLVGFYIASIVNTTLYGAAGSLIVVLLWIYYSSQVFFFGASFTYLYAKERQSRQQ